MFGLSALALVLLFGSRSSSLFKQWQLSRVVLALPSSLAFTFTFAFSSLTLIDCEAEQQMTLIKSGLESARQYQCSQPESLPINRQQFGRCLAEIKANFALLIGSLLPLTRFSQVIQFEVDVGRRES